MTTPHVQLICSACGGDRVSWDEPAHQFVSCPACKGTGLEDYPASGYLLAYLAGSRDLREILVRCDATAQECSKRAAELRAKGFRELANLAAVEAACCGQFRDALVQFASRVAQQAAAKPPPAPRGVQIFHPKEGP